MCKGSVRVLGYTGQQRLIQLADTEEQMQQMTVKQLKERTSAAFPCTGGNNENSVRMHFKNKELGNITAKLSEYGIKYDSVIHLTLRVHGG